MTDEGAPGDPGRSRTMAIIRTISYDPESMRRERIARANHPTWILCRKHQQFPIEDDLALHRLAEQGRVRSADILVNPVRDVMVRAKDLPELQVSLRKAAVQRVRRFSGVLAAILAAFWSVSGN